MTGRRRGLTLIELIVVIAIITFVMALSLPALQRVQREAKVVVCQSNLRQWGTIWDIHTTDNGGHFPGSVQDEPHPGWWWVWPGPFGNFSDYSSTSDISCCPMADKPASTTGKSDPHGGTFLAWGRFHPKGTWPWDSFGSYGTNRWTCWPFWPSNQPEPNFWQTPNVKGAGGIPLHLDSCWPWSWISAKQAPPECDAIPAATSLERHAFCINRHDAHVNGLFMDWSVRKIGLKELWTLKWHRRYNTANRWTRAGGARGEDWPEWMRSFKDY